MTPKSAPSDSQFDLDFLIKVVGEAKLQLSCCCSLSWV